MGLIWDRAEDEAIISAFASNLKVMRQFADDIRTQIEAVVATIDDGTLSGAAYTAASQLYKELYLPISRSLNLLTDRLEADTQRYVGYRGRMDGLNYFNEDDLHRAIDTYKQMNRSIESIDQATFKLTNGLFEWLYNRNQTAMRQLENMITQAREFDLLTKNLFSKYDSEMDTILRGIRYVKTGTLHADGTFTPAPDSDDSWRKELPEDDFDNLVGDIKRPKGMSVVTYVRYKEAIYQQVKALQKEGWADRSLTAFTKYVSDHMEKHGITLEKATAYLTQVVKQTSEIGSDVFLAMWNADGINLLPQSKQEAAATKKLKLLMKFAKMTPHFLTPGLFSSQKAGYGDLSGSQDQTKMLLNVFAHDQHDQFKLAPDADFWDNLARTVRYAFPDGFIKAKDQALAKEVHQYRYVISAQQQDYIRNFGKANHCKSDEDALALYLSQGHPYSLDESARLHQKKSEYGHFPADYKDTNIKVVENFHTEFIIDGKGHLINEVDSEKSPEKK